MKFTVYEVVISVNLALYKPTYQTSTYPGGDSSKAVDGRVDTYWGAKSCTATTSADTHPWWRVDLGGISTITDLNLVNRGDGWGMYNTYIINKM